MNELQKRVYRELLELTIAESNIFIAVDNTIDGVSYRIFTYRLISSYEKWLTNDSALECRGITFEMREQQPVRLASWPFEKFFNLNENPMTKDLNLSNPREILLKEDGSLISSLLVGNGEDMHLKSKGSLHSEQAKAANELIRKPEFSALYQWVLSWTQKGFTVILEYVSPFNRIVVPYETSTLKLLAIRNNSDGSYVNLHGLDLAPEIEKLVVENLGTRIDDDPKSFLEKVSEKQGIEGYVVRLASGQRVKIKTDWYNGLHKNNQYNVLSGNSLVRVILDDTVDDLRSMYAHSPEILKKIDSATAKVASIYNETVQVTSAFVEENQTLCRRDFAVLAKTQLTRFHFGLAMQLFTGKTVDYVESVFQFIKREGGIELDL